MILLTLMAPVLASDLMPPMEAALDIELGWREDAGWWLSPITDFDEGGDRMAALVTADGPLWLEVRAVDEAGVAGPWRTAEETWRGGDGQRVLAVDLARWSPGAQVRVWGLDSVASLGWALHVVAPEPERSAPPRPPSVSAALSGIGVIARETWGADPTTCSSYEDDWYRYAIHHTAGGQTSGGTVQGAVQSLQAYAFSTGSYCDIPYQFLVGYDGSLWEGRPLDFTSGATGGGNNDGNIAICFLGCYDSAYCDSSGGDADTLAMMAAARLLAQTLADEHAAPTTADTLRGHQDWPDNATACPGDKVMARLDEVRSAGAHFQGAYMEDAWGGAVTMAPGETVSGWVAIRNDGIETWTSNTKLAPLPRDEASALADAAWESASRVGPPVSDVAPGETGQFLLTIHGAAEGTSSLELALVEEWVTWFADVPVGGGPAEGAIALTVTVTSDTETTTPTDDTGADTDASDTGGAGPGGGGPGGRGPGEDDALGATFGERALLTDGKGCGCAAPGPAPPPLIGWLLGAAALARRRWAVSHRAASR